MHFVSVWEGKKENLLSPTKLPTFVFVYLVFFFFFF